MMRDHDDTPRNSNELILNPGEYAFLQDKTTGGVQTHVGPIVVTQTGQLRPIRFSNGSFEEALSLHQSVQRSVRAEKGQYLILSSPSVDGNGLHHPTIRNTNASVPDLSHGEKIVIPGPVQFALWPEQSAEVVGGHNLRNDQFLVVRVYDEEAAVANWGDAVVQGAEDDEAVVAQTAEQLGLTLGQLLVIKGVAFYIPPTGIEVVADEGSLVRDALTLEMSEYAILVDQSGNKRYEQGPQIVFPEPTEEFFSDAGGNIKFKPIELTPTQGIHIKINCDYTDPVWPTETSFASRAFKEGDEVFITGATHPIYYPCEEHSIVRYGDNLVHFATAVSAGQARYVMDKETGEIRTVSGPDMLLLDPTKEVFVTRVLSDAESLLMYPGNQDSLRYNQELRSFQTDDDLAGPSALLEANFRGYGDNETRTMRAMAAAAPAALPDQIRRKTTYTKPHAVTLDDRFAGAPTLKIWTGFAVLLVKADGQRRVEVGPKVVTLDFDETVAPLHLSTGKPKNTDNLLTTGYLEVKNNKVSDIVEIETVDGVRVQLKLSYRVSFTGDHDSWFDVDNYVKFLCDHCRSRLKGVARRHDIRGFSNDSVAIVRDNILGTKVEGEPRTGLVFEENGMQITDVELLGVNINDGQISEMLGQQQKEVVTNQIEIDRANQQLEVVLAQQGVARQKALALDETRQVEHAISLARLSDGDDVAKLNAEQALARSEEKVILTGKDQESADIAHVASLGRQTAMTDLELRVEEAKTEAIIAKFGAVGGDLSAAIRELGDKQVLKTTAEAMGPMRLLGGADLSTLISGLIGAASGDSSLVRRLTNAVRDAED